MQKRDFRNPVLRFSQDDELGRCARDLGRRAFRELRWPGGGAIQGISAIRRGVTRLYGFATAMIGSLFQRPKHSDWEFFTSALFRPMS